ncbi:MAG: zf-HC2 domain-containing protein, partial [Gemmatimonadaceae bacterium]
MNHLDEGTIHSWLDGALDAPQSREIEAHVADCAACSAAVAEARGLIAGASRILGALDDVPAGVIPAGASAAPEIPKREDVVPIAARRQAGRQWRVTRWASGIAAVLIGAVVLSTVHRIDRTMEVPQAAPGLAFDT